MRDRAVADRRGTRCARRYHATDRGVRARIHREEQARVAQVLIERFAGDPRLHDTIRVFRRDAQHRIHSRQIQREPAVRSTDLPFERCARTKRDDRQSVPGADPHHARDVIGALRIRHGVGQVQRRVRFAAAVLLAGRCIDAEHRAELAAEFGDPVWLDRHHRDFLAGVPESPTVSTSHCPVCLASSSSH